MLVFCFVLGSLFSGGIAPVEFGTSLQSATLGPLYVATQLIQQVTLFALAGHALFGLLQRRVATTVFLILIATAKGAWAFIEVPTFLQTINYVGPVVGILIWMVSLRVAGWGQTTFFLSLVSVDFLSRNLLPLLFADSSWDTPLSNSFSHGLVDNLVSYAATLWLIQMSGASMVAVSVVMAMLLLCLQFVYTFSVGGTQDFWQPAIILVLGQASRLPRLFQLTSSYSERTENDGSASGERRDSATRTGYAITWLVVLYVVLIAYASLYPLTGWQSPRQPLWLFLQWPWVGAGSRADLFSNILAYIPLGLLLMQLFKSHDRFTLPAIICVTILGSLLSFSMESLQQFLPTRTPSIVDLITNTLGTLLGAVIGVVAHVEGNFAIRARALRDEWCMTDPLVNAGLLALAVWMMSQLSPFVPSLDLGSIKASLSAIRQVVHQPVLFVPSTATLYGLNILGLGLVATTLIRADRNVFPVFAFFASCTLALKIFVATRVLSPESLLGLVVSLTVLGLVKRMPRRIRAWVALGVLMTGFAVAETIPGQGALQAFNWIPFAGEIDNTLNGFASILATLWPFIAAGYLANLLAPSLRFSLMIPGMFVIGAFTGLLELMQTLLPGRYGDVTTILLAVIGWTVPWYWRSNEKNRPARIDQASA